MYFLLSGCENPTILQLIMFCKIIFKIVCIAIPIALIVMLFVDFTKNIVAKDESTQKKNLAIAIKRIIYAIVLFLLPTIIALVMNMLSNLGFSIGDCSSNATKEKIEYYKQLEKVEIKQEEENRKENQNFNTSDEKLNIHKSETSNDTSNDTDNNSSSNNSDDSSKSDVKKTVVDGVTYFDGVLVVNKTYSIPSSYVPKDPYKSIASGTNKCLECLEKDTMDAYKKMNADASALGLNLNIVSGFRSYNYQQQMYNNKVAERGQEDVDKTNARPGHSEHQTGLAIDLVSVQTSFANTAEGKWLNNNCHLYGFIIRYPKGKEGITGYSWEPWHVRYIGKDLASKLYNNGNWITLEEHFGITSSYN